MTSGPTGRVFVVDDDTSVRRSLARLIKAAGHEVEAFGSARDFLARPPSQTPACLVLDVQMPELGGLELQDMLARGGQFLATVFITGYGDVSASVRAMKGGAVDFLTKPVDKRELLEAIGRALARAGQAYRDANRLAEVRSRMKTLTPREAEVLALVVTGMLNKQVAFELGVSEKMVKVHRARVMAKMRAGSLAELVRLADEGRTATTAVAPAPERADIDADHHGPRATIPQAADTPHWPRIDHPMSTALPLISIVDDDVSVRRALRRTVQSAGYPVETFACAVEFLDSVPLRRTACLVLDIHLDGMSGLELRERLVADGVDIPVVFITAHDDAVTRERARGAGAVAYLRKPFDNRVLLDAIKRALHPVS